MAGLEFNNATGEPFLRLPEPFTNIIITPPRTSDLAPSVKILNDPVVATWMGMGPYPTARAEKWIAKIRADADGFTAEMRGGGAAAGPIGGCPVRHIREVQPDETEVYVGDAGLVRSGYTEVLDAVEKARLVAENHARAPGDPEIAWHIGYYLAPSHQGLGLMSAVVGALITQLGIPWMKTRRIRSSAFEGNYGSLKVLLKNGFVLEDALAEHVQVGDEETRRTLHLLEWRH
ncbi:hypothetical protein C8R43DRAFT_964457 [Mycena crocata]|nr:hypothetical protein C8R43DRAFT_964457 [Mycena crocata]